MVAKYTLASYCLTFIECCGPQIQNTEFKTYHSKEERVGWAVQQSQGKGEESSAGVSAARPQYPKEWIWISRLDSLWYIQNVTWYSLFLAENCIAFNNLSHWPRILTTVSFQKIGQILISSGTGTKRLHYIKSFCNGIGDGTKCKTCFGGPRMILHAHWKNTFLFWSSSLTISWL